MSETVMGAPSEEVMREQEGSFELGAQDQKRKQPSRVSLFLRSSAFDFVLTLIASVALVFTVSYGFESAPDIRNNVLLDALLCAVPLLIMFAGSWSKKALPASIVGTVVYAVVVVGVCMAMTPAETPLFVEGAINDVAENLVIFGFVVIVVPVLVYLLSRRPFGALVLFIASTFTCAFVQYLYRDWIMSDLGIVAFIAVVVSTLSLVMYQRYRSSIYKVKKLDGTAFAAVSTFSVVTSLVCVVIAIALYYGFVAPLGLTTVEIKPFEDTYSKPIEYYTGVYETQDIQDPNLVSGYVSDENRQTSQNAQGGTSQQEDKETEETNQDPLTSFIEGVTTFDSDSWTQQFSAMNYKEFALWALVVVAVIVVLAIIIVLLQRRRRKMRIARLEEKNPSYAVWWLYDFLAKRFERLGFKRPKHMTLLEYALSNRQNMKLFERGTGGVDWLDCTLAYQRACLADGSATKEDFETLKKYYEAFYPNAFKYAGVRRWFWLFWRL